MAMTGSGMGSAIKAAVDAVTAATPSGTAMDRSALFNAIGTAIVSYIQSNAVVSVASVSGVQPGSGSSGVGAGTIA